MLQGAAMPATDVVTVFLVHDGRILVLRRRDKVGTERDRWAGVGGYLEQAPSDRATRDLAPRDRAYTEIAEETGLGPNDIELVKEGDPLHVRDREADRLWRVHPFLFAVTNVAGLRLDRERVERRWVWPTEIEQLDTAPQLADALRRVYP